MASINQHIETRIAAKASWELGSEMHTVAPLEAMTPACASNLTRDQWDLLSSLLPGAKATGRPRTGDLYDVVNAILYRLMSGCAWAL